MSALAAEYLRPKAAAARFGVHRRTLLRWAKAGLIGRSRVGGVTHYRADDIAELLAANTAGRTVIPYVAPSTTAPIEDWAHDPLWSDRRDATGGQGARR